MFSRVLAVLVVVTLNVSHVCAGQFSTVDVDTPSGPGKYILVLDDIDVGDWSQFFRLVRREPAISGVMLQSMGGSADDGLAIAKYIFEHKFDTMVTGACHSICAVMFLAGERRYMTDDAVITVHSAYKQLGDWVVADHQANGTVTWFLGHMGYPLPLARLWLSTPSEAAAPITLEMNDRLALGLTVIGRSEDQ